MIRALKMKAGKHRVIHGKGKPISFTDYKTGDILPYDEKLAKEINRYEVIEVSDNFFSSEKEKSPSPIEIPPIPMETSSKRRRDGGESK